MILHLILFLAFFQVSAFETGPLDYYLSPADILKAQQLFQGRNMEGLRRLQEILPHKITGKKNSNTEGAYLCATCWFTSRDLAPGTCCEHPLQKKYRIGFGNDSEIKDPNAVLTYNPWLFVREVESGQITVHGTIARRQTTTTQAPVHTFA